MALQAAEKRAKSQLSNSFTLARGRSRAPWFSLRFSDETIRVTIRDCYYSANHITGAGSVH